MKIIFIFYLFLHFFISKNDSFILKQSEKCGEGLHGKHCDGCFNFEHFFYLNNILIFLYP